MYDAYYDKKSYVFMEWFPFSVTYIYFFIYSMKQDDCLYND